MELTVNQLKEIWSEEAIYDEAGEVLIYEVVETGEWQDEGKFSSKEVIFKEVSTGKHYSFYLYRSGSYFSFYEYEVYDTAIEVKKIIKTIEIEKWVAV